MLLYVWLLKPQAMRVHGKNKFSHPILQALVNTLNIKTTIMVIIFKLQEMLQICTLYTVIVDCFVDL